MTDDAKITTIAGGKKGHTTAPGKPVPEVIAALRDALTLAESGELVAVAIAMVRDRSGNIRMSADFAYRGQTSSDLYLAIDVARERLIEHLREGITAD